MRSTWTPDREARVRELWQAGWTAAQIADDLGLKSPTSVLGKVRSLGLPRRPKTRAQVRRHAHPLVRTLVRECIEQDITYEELARRSGVAMETIQRWGRISMPRLDNIAAAYNALGLDLVVQPLVQPTKRRPSEATLNDLLHHASDVSHVPVQVIRRRDRTFEAAFGRHMFCWLAREYTSASFPKIARFIGLRDHTSAIYGHRRIAAMIASGEIERPAPPPAPANVAPMRPALALEAAE